MSICACDILDYFTIVRTIKPTIPLSFLLDSDSRTANSEILQSSIAINVHSANNNITFRLFSQTP